MGSAFDRWSPSIVQAILFAVGGGLVFIGQEFGVPYTTDVGIILLGILMVAVGTDITIKKLGVFRSEAWANHHVVDAYRTVADLLWAFVFVIGGLAAAGVVLVKWFVPSAPETFWEDILGSTTAIGAILGLVGLMILVDGLIRAIVGSGRVDPQRLGGLMGAFDRGVGAVTAVVGLGVAALGLVMVVAPRGVDELLEMLMELLGGP